MQLDAPFSELNGERRRMRSLLFAALNGLVGNEPRVTATTQIAPSRMRPARNVAFVLIRNAKCKPVQFGAAGLREMKNVLVAIVEKPLRVDRLEMAVGFDDRLRPSPGASYRHGIADWVER